jgi:Na+-transporting methylmalonyl-CoA/oxaloacetate decarboxylase gamma subunit
MTTLIITESTWMMAGISVAVVFVILVLLVGVLHIFSVIAAKAPHAKGPRVLEVAPAPEEPLLAGKPSTDAEDERLAAVAVAVHLFLSRAHDDESGVITINQAASQWHAVLNPRL